MLERRALSLNGFSRYWVEGLMLDSTNSFGKVQVMSTGVLQF